MAEIDGNVSEMRRILLFCRSCIGWCTCNVGVIPCGRLFRLCRRIALVLSFANKV
jgi:hypothetical protein